MKRILQIVGGMNRAGAETMLMNLYRNIDRNKYQFDFVYFTYDKCDYDEEIRSMGGRIFTTQRFKGEEVSVFKRAMRLREIINDNASFHAVHSHTLFSSSFHLGVAKFCNISKRIAHSHNTNDVNSTTFIGRLYQKFSRLLIHCFATDFIACGEAASKYLFLSSDSEKVLFLPNAIDLDKFTLKKEHKIQLELGLGFHKKMVLQIGRLSQVKNFEFTIKLASYLKTIGNDDFHFIFVGQGPDLEKLKKLREDLKVNDLITFLGVRGDIPNLFANSDIMLMPSYHEGFPVVLVEAQAAGLPSVISTNISREVDLGINLVSFCSLEQDYKEWIIQMEIGLNNKNEDVDFLKQILTKKGFSVIESAVKLQKLYA
ncbi:MAG: glycosyltransferase [Flavobacteriaceae bacterium]|nr:glycosyltransferase [Flavobacteriaceae bacterium]